MKVLFFSAYLLGEHTVLVDEGAWATGVGIRKRIGYFKIKKRKNKKLKRTNGVEHMKETTSFYIFLNMVAQNWAVTLINN